MKGVGDGRTVQEKSVIHVKVSNHDVGSGRNDQDRRELTRYCPVEEQNARNHHNNCVDLSSC
jgi:hypothetical protein